MDIKEDKFQKVNKQTLKDLNKLFEELEKESLKNKKQ